MLKKYAPLMIIVAGACWGALGIFVRALNGYGVASMEIVESRSIVATAVFGLGILCYDRRLFRIKFAHGWCFLGTGVIGITLFNFCYFQTIKAASLSVAAVLLYTAPIFVMLFSAVLFKEVITRRKVICLIMAFTGCMLVSGIFGAETALNSKGILIGLCAGLGYALYTVFARYSLNYGYHPLTLQFYTFLTSLISGAFITDFDQLGHAVSANGFPVIGAILCISIVSTVIPNIFYSFGMQHVDNGKTSVMASIEPVMAIIFGMVFFSEFPTPVAVVGMLLSITAIILINTQKGQNKDEA